MKLNVKLLTGLILSHLVNEVIGSDSGIDEDNSIDADGNSIGNAIVEQQLNVEQVYNSEKDDSSSVEILNEINDKAEDLIEIVDEGDHTENETTKIQEKSRPIQFYSDFGKFHNEEYLEIKPLKGNNVLFSFNFAVNSTTELYPEQDSTLHYDVFSKSLGSIMSSTNTRELHLRFGHGWYDAEFNGKLANNGETSGGTGVELWASIESQDKEKAKQEWKKLANYLSGMFCASFNFIDSSISSYPVNLFRHDHSLLENISLKDSLFDIRSALPREPVCTENLTPFLKLLPTKGKAGISTLLSGNKVFNAEWSSMSVDVVTHCTDYENCQYIMTQTINLILNVPKILERNEMPIPKPIPGSKLRCDTSKVFDAYNCFPLPSSAESHYDLIDLFGKVIEGGSLIASSPSKVCIDVDLNNYQIEFLTLAPVSTYKSEGKICMILESDAEYNIRLNTNDSGQVENVESPPIFASRSLSGFSQDNGGFRLDVYNPSDEDMDLIIFETLPWFVRLYLHSMTLTLTSEANQILKICQVNDPLISDYIKEIVYNPAIDREAPTHFELLVKLPAHTKMKLSFDFDKAMLLYAEYPPDANHGFELEPAIFALIDKDTRKVNYIMRTTTSLLTLPTPDFSMPYNVIIFTATVMSVLFGSLFNLMIKKTVTEEEFEKVAAQSFVSKIKAKIFGIFNC